MGTLTVLTTLLVSSTAVAEEGSPSPAPSSQPATDAPTKSVVRMGPIITGAVVLGTALTVGAVAGSYAYATRGNIVCDGGDGASDMSDDQYMGCPSKPDYHLHFLIPFAGPWMGVAYYADQPRNTSFEVFSFATLGLAQAGGLITLLSGFVFQREVPVSAETVSVSPTHAGRPGLDVSLRF